MLNVRKIKDELNVFSGILSAYTYMSVFAIIILLQVRCHAALRSCGYKPAFASSSPSGTTLPWEADGDELE